MSEPGNGDYDRNPRRSRKTNPDADAQAAAPVRDPRVTRWMRSDWLGGAGAGGRRPRKWDQPHRPCKPRSFRSVSMVAMTLQIVSRSQPPQRVNQGTPQGKLRGGPRCTTRDDAGDWKWLESRSGPGAARRERSTAGSSMDSRKRPMPRASAEESITICKKNESPRKDRAERSGNATDRNGLHHGSIP